jgi:hypothetical protein
MHDIVDQNHSLAIEHKGNVTRADARIGKRRRRVVSIERDVYTADRALIALQLPNPPLQAPGNRDAATTNAYEDEITACVVSLEDFSRDSAQTTTDALFIEKISHRERELARLDVACTTDRSPDLVTKPGLP